MKSLREMKISICIQIFIALVLFCWVVNENVSIRLTISIGIIVLIWAVFLVYFIYLPNKKFYSGISKIINSNNSINSVFQNEYINNFRLWDANYLIDELVNAINDKSEEMSKESQAKINLLQSQISPHFLYNTLESIRGQAILDDNKGIADMMEALAAFFRYSISRKGNLVTLRDELNNIGNYMFIQRYRFNNRFDLEVCLDEEDEAVYDYLVPKLMIQPIIENAIFHGLEEIVEEGKVIIDIVVTKSKMLITVSDNGKGMDEETLEKLNKSINNGNMLINRDKRSNGIALNNVNERIKLIFGEDYGIRVYSTLGIGTDVEITIPIN